MAVAACSTAAFGGPDVQEVVYGDVRFVFDGQNTTIFASDGSIINYFNFNIGPDELVQFVQPHDAARVLNRINSVMPTLIQGRLMANGQVYIINPSGVLFTPTSVVDASGLYAAAGNMNNQDFIDGVNQFHGLTGDVINEGVISGKSINLLGHRVANHGAIRADGGLVAMIAGNEVLLREQDGHIFARVDGTQLTDAEAPQHGGTTPDMTALPGVENTGTITADHGSVFLGAGDHYALAIHNVGSIRGGGGNVQMAAADGLVHNRGTVDVSHDDHGGSITMQGPSVMNDGVLRADSDHGVAGSIEVTSQNHTYLRDGSVISAAGGDGGAEGGDVLVHSYAGTTVFADGSLIDVSGGVLGGRGGFVEVSGAGLAFNGAVLLDAALSFEPGTLLIDPHHIFIRETGTNDDFLDDTIIEFDEGGPAMDVVISAAALAAITGQIELQALGSITVQTDVNLIHNNDVLLLANGLITLQSAINGANNLVALADYDGDGFGWVSFDRSLDLTGFLDVTGSDIILNNDISITTAMEQVYHGRLQVGGDVTLSGSELFFNGTIDSKFINGPTPNQRLTLNGVSRFMNPVGQTSPLRSLTTNGITKLAGGPVITNEFQLYNGPAILEKSAVLTSLGAGDITFAQSVDLGNDLTVNTAGATRFEGTVGGFVPLGALETDAEGTTVIAGDITARTVALNDAVTLDNDVTVTGTESVLFASTIEGGGNDLRVNSPDTTFEDVVTGTGVLATDVDGVTRIKADMTGQAFTFGDVVELIGDTHIDGVDLVLFNQTIDGPFELEIDSEGLVLLGGDVGGDVALAMANIDGLLILIDGELIRAEGDILLQESGFDEVPLLATVGASGGLTVDSANGDIRVGPLVKITAAGGDLVFLAPNGTLTVGDLNALGDISATAQQIELLLREAGMIQLPDGTIVQDSGLDIVAGGTITSNVAPVFIGTGPDPVFSSGDDTLHALIEAIIEHRGHDGLTAEAFLFLTAILDLRAPGIGGGIGQSLAEAIPRLPQPITDHTPREPFATQPLQRLAIYVRGMDDSELRSSLTGSLFLDDTSDVAPESEGAQPTVTSRLRRDSVLAVAARYGELFETVDEDVTGDPAVQAEHIRDILGKAWTTYAAEPDATPTGFRDFCAEHDDDETLVYLDGLGELFQEMWIMGATKRELRRSLQDVLEPICPEAMTVGELETAIGADEIG